MPAARGNNGGMGREPGRLRPLRGRPEPRDAASPEEAHYHQDHQELPTRTDYSQSAFEYHAALLGENRSSQLSGGLERAMIVRRLQRDYGNRYVQRLVAHISRKRAEGVQTKLTVGPAGDRFEQEADQVAKEVMGALSAPSSQEPAQRQGPDEEELQMKALVQRQGPEEEELQMKALAQRQVPLEGGDVEPGAESAIQQAKGGGQALPDNVRSSMEGAFGADFSGVRVHDNSQADALNNSMSSVAFTTGRDIFFRKGEYNPGNSGGKELLAHELTHVVQQNGSGLEPKEEG